LHFAELLDPYGEFAIITLPFSWLRCFPTHLLIGGEIDDSLGMSRLRVMQRLRQELEGLLEKDLFY